MFVLVDLFLLIGYDKKILGPMQSFPRHPQNVLQRFSIVISIATRRETYTQINQVPLLKHALHTAQRAKVAGLESQSCAILRQLGSLPYRKKKPKSGDNYK